MTIIQISLADDLHRQADEMGLFESTAFSRLLRDEIRRRALRSMISLSTRMSAINETPMTEEEIVAEVKAARAERAACP